MDFRITGIDLLLILLYFPIIYGCGVAYSNRFKYNILRNYFRKGLLLKLFCGLGFAGIYIYYYGGGDTTKYFEGASYIFNQVFNGQHGFKVFFNPELMPYGTAKEATTFTQQFAGALNLFSFNSFWACTLLFSALSFIGTWLLFISFFRQFPKLHKQLAIATLFIPGVAFWSAGIMKDTLCLLFVGIIVYYIQNIFLYNKKKVFSAVMVGTGFYIIIILKAYIALALLIAIAIYAVLTIKTHIKNPTIRVILMPLLTLVIAGVAFISMRQIGESLERYSLENIMETAQTYQGYHTRTSVAGRGSANRTGSAYTLGNINYNSPTSIISKIPLAINVTFFRPYLWEVRNPVMLLSALESTFILFFALSILRKTGIKLFFSNIFKSKEVLFCLTFAMIFGFAVGFTTYNFGSLVRYKAPCIPFFIISLVLLNDLASKKIKPVLKGKKSTSQKELHAI